MFIFLLLCGGAFAAEHDALFVQGILERYTEMMGGTRSIDALTSVSIEGTQIQHGKSYHFLMRKKRPGSMHYRLSAEGSSIVCGYNGQGGWQRVEDAAGQVKMEELSADQLSPLREEASFDSPLFRHLEKSANEFTVSGYESVGEALAYVLELREHGRLTTRYYLDLRSSHLLKRELLDADGAVRLETLYRDYRPVDDYWFAFEVENRFGGVQVSLIQIETILLNPGLLNFYFEMPSH
jgi:hypothetical protein